jgi:serine/threonine protein kinase
MTGGDAPPPAEDGPAAPRHRQTIPAGYALRRRYRLGEVIARGGMSTVYRATDGVRVRARAADTEVAVKIVDLTGPGRDDAIELIHREARRMRDLAHPNIVRVYDSDIDGPFHFIVMELLAGETLAQRLRRTPGAGLPVEAAFGLVAAIAAALDFAHAAGVVHGDLKPSNVFLTAGGEVKLLDFGLAFAAAGAAVADDDDPTIVYLSRVGGLTPSFAACEMLAGGEPTPASDVFALGVIAYLALTGRHPFDRRSALDARTHGLVPFRPDGLDRRRWRALSAALAFDPAARPGGAGAFAAALAAPSWWQRLGRAGRTSRPAGQPSSSRRTPVTERP